MKRDTLRSVLGFIIVFLGLHLLNTWDRVKKAWEVLNGK